MIRAELVKLTETVCEKKTELQNIELKAANRGCPTRLYDTLSSFSNQDSGGVLIFGIDESAGFLLWVFMIYRIYKKSNRAM